MNRACKLLLLMVVSAAPLLAQVSAEKDDDPAKQPSAFEKVRQQAAEMIKGFHQLGDWDQHYAYQMDAIEKVYERNGWDSESDLFSLELARDVEKIPPWNVRERFDRVLGMISDRYLLDDSQEQLLQSLIFRENQKLFAKHSSEIMQYAMDAIQTRAAGEPFTPDQVARWVKLAEPVFEDSRKSMMAAAGEFMQHLDPEQQDLVRSDLNAANRRMDAMEKMAVRWKRGEWNAADWGLEDDPIQNPNGAALAAQTGDQPAGEATKPGMPAAAGTPAPNPGKPAAPRQNTPAVAKRGAATPNPEAPPPPPEARKDAKRTASAKDDDPWAKYVREFIAKYQLTDDQQQKAWLFHKDARKRADAVDKRFARLTAGAKDADNPRTAARLAQAKEQHDTDTSRLFDRMKQRLDQLPTRAQRRKAAESEKPAEPEKSSAKAKAKP